ncbi:MAG: hypothetical protein ABJE63_02010 [Lentilitoribacter sp.]
MAMNTQQRAVAFKQNRLSIAMGSGSLTDQKKAMIAYLSNLDSQTDAVQKVLANHHSASLYHRYNNKYGPVQSNAKTRTGNRHVSTVNAVNNGHVNLAMSKGGQYSSNFQVRGGQKLLEPFDGLPLCFIHAGTINAAYVYDHADLRIVARDIKERISHCYDQLSPDAIIRGYLDMKMVFADSKKYVIPADETSISYAYAERDHEIVAMIHPHFIVYEPQMPCDDVRDVFAKEFPGNSRVCCRKPHTEKVNANGEITHGIQGYGEYCALQKIELECGRRNGEALEKYVELDSTWDGRSKLIRHGSRSVSTITCQNMDRYDAYINELTEKRVANRWNDIDYSRRFMYLWFTHVSDIKDICASLSEQSCARHDDQFIRNVIQFLCCLSYEEQKSFSSYLYELLNCMLSPSWLLNNSDMPAKAEKRNTAYIYLYSNSTPFHCSRRTGNAGFLTPQSQYTTKQHHQLVPP